MTIKFIKKTSNIIGRFVGYSVWLTIAAIILKLSNIIHWNYYLVFSALLLTIGVALLFFVFALSEYKIRERKKISNLIKELLNQHKN